MAGFTESANSEQIYPRNESFIRNEVFTSKEKLNQPCDVVLVVEDGKQFKAHKNVLKDASPFFEKLLNSDMKESREGIVRLEMFSESVMATSLEFMYTGHVQILNEENARDLIVITDYLLLQKLKTLAEEVLAEQKLNISNCISTYHFSERYQCTELQSKTKKFILANFTAVYAANREEVLNMTSREVKMWISSDEIDISAEEDVLKIILAWIDHDKSKRKEYFAELFSEVRLVYVSRDFLISDVVTNDLVKENEGCLELVKDAIDSIDSKNYDNLPVPPRKSLETPLILTLTDDEIFCCCPEEDNWYILDDMERGFNLFNPFNRCNRVVPCHGKLYVFEISYRFEEDRQQILRCYSPYSNSWMVLPFSEENRVLLDIFVNNEDEMYALARERSTHLEVSIILKYKPLSNSWEDVTSFDSFELRRHGRHVCIDFCIVAKDNFIYFIGGKRQFHESTNAVRDVDRNDAVRYVDRYDLSINEWKVVASIQVARSSAYGAATKGKIFIVGGFNNGVFLSGQIEVYDETLNEWQFISRQFSSYSLHNPNNLLSIDDDLYAVDMVPCWHNCKRLHIIIFLYFQSALMQIGTQISRDISSMINETNE
ncbi:hypothetical protein ACROYT_G044138 [Oculina patagonica]